MTRNASSSSAYVHVELLHQRCSNLDRQRARRGVVRIIILVDILSVGFDTLWLCSPSENHDLCDLDTTHAIAELSVHRKACRVGVVGTSTIGGGARV